MKRFSGFMFAFIAYLIFPPLLVFAQEPCPTVTPGGQTAPGIHVCNTAIGPISTNPTAFISTIFTIVLSLSGAIAILLIMFSGYQLILSAGNPEKTQAARETLTSAIIGLLFIIFSVVILQVIGVDILHLPGFGK